MQPMTINGVEILPLEITCGMTATEVIRSLNAIIRRLWGNNEETFSLALEWDQPGSAGQTWLSLIRRWRWLAAYAVQGDSEGHYIHVDMANGYTNAGGTTKHLLCCKTFNGFRRAQELACLVQFVLTAGCGDAFRIKEWGDARKI